MAGTSDHVAFIWDAQTGETLGKALWHGSSVTAAAFGPGGKNLVTGSQEGLVRFWNLSDDSQDKVAFAWNSGNRARLKTIQNHALLSHDGKSILTYVGESPPAFGIPKAGKPWEKPSAWPKGDDKPGGL